MVFLVFLSIGFSCRQCRGGSFCLSLCFGGGCLSGLGRFGLLRGKCFEFGRAFCGLLFLFLRVIRDFERREDGNLIECDHFAARPNVRHLVVDELGSVLEEFFFTRTDGKSVVVVEDRDGDFGHRKTLPVGQSRESPLF